MKKLLLFAVFLTLIQTVQASHIAGGDLSYASIGNNKYVISLNLFVDCLGFDPGAQQTVNFNSTCGGTETLTVNCTNPGGTEISQLCSSQIGNSTCHGGTLPGMWVFHYTDTVILAPICDTWTMSWNTCCRNAAILNLQTPDSFGSYLQAILNSATDSSNNSPAFTSQPIPYVCANQQVVYNYGVVEIDGDSLHYSLINAMDAGNFGGFTNLAYNGGYSATSPIPGIAIDSVTGVLTFTPTSIGNFVVVVQVDEYDHNGNLIGSVMRDIQFVVQNCSNNVPSPNAGAITGLTGTAVQTGPFAVEMCEGSNFTFTATFTDPDINDTLHLVSNIATVLPGSTIITSGTNPLTATISWLAPGGTANTNTSFSVTVNDGSCPVVGQQTFVYDINVQPRTLAGADKIICGSQTATLTATGGSSFTWSVVNGHPMVVGTNFSCDTCTTVVASPDSTTTYEVVSNLNGTCINRDTVTVFVVPDFTFTTTQSTDTLCFQQPVQFNISGSPAGAYTYLWSPSTYLDVDTIANPTASITVPGSYNYAVNITSPFGCLKRDTVTAVVLPEIRTYAFADTVLCLNQSAILSTNGGSSFVWSVITGPAMSVGTNFSCNACATPSATPTATTTYQVTSNLGGTCINKDTVTVTVVPNFTTTVTQSDTVTCLLQPVIQLNVSAAPAGTYTYEWASSTLLSDTSIANPTANTIIPGTHIFVATVTSSTGCVKKDSATIIITPSYKPNPVAYGDPQACAGDTINLGVTFGTTTPSVCGTSSVGCSAALTAVAGTGTAANSTTSFPAPYGNWYTSAKHQFLFRASELNALGITGGKIDQLDFNVTQINGITTYHDYSISMGCTDQSSLSGWVGSLSNVYTPKPVNVSTGWNSHPFDLTYEWDGSSNLVVEICFAEPGTFNYTNNCISPYTTTAFTSALYYVTDLNPACADMSTPTTSNNRPNTRFHYCGGAPDSAVYTYNWYQPSTVLTPTHQTTEAYVATSGTSNYFVIVRDTVSGCFDTAYLAVPVAAPIVLSVNAGNDTTICPGVSVMIHATGATNYVWSPATALSSIITDTTTATPAGTITYVVTGTSNCTTGPAHDSITITVLTAVNLAVNAGSDQDICALPFNLTGASTGGFGSNSYSWSIYAGSTVDTIQNHTSATALVAPSEESVNTYQLMVTDFCGDTASDYTNVNVIMDCKLKIPNVFTPNGDGKNDEFVVTGIGMKTFSISIFDRWGKKVFESTDIKESWNGKSADDGTYYYMIKAESLNGKKFDENGYLLRAGH